MYKSGRWKQRSGEIPSIYQVESGAQGDTLFPENGERHTDQLSLHQDCKAHRC